MNNFKMLLPLKDIAEDREITMQAKRERETAGIKPLPAVADPVQATKDDLTVEAMNRGQSMANVIFRKRGNHSEVHLSKNDLTAMLALAYEFGVKAR